MTTVINNPGDNGDSSTGIIIGVVVALLLIVLFFMYGLPALQQNRAADNSSGGAKIEVNLPSGGVDNHGGDTNGSAAGAGSGSI